MNYIDGKNYISELLGLIKRLGPVYNKTLICAAISAAMMLPLPLVTAASAGLAANRPIDERILEKLDKDESLGFTAFGDIDGDKKDDIIITVDKISKPAMEEAPASKLAMFDGEKIKTIDDFSVYIEKLMLADVDSCGKQEVIFLRRGGMKNLLEVFVLKAEKNSANGEIVFKSVFKSDGVIDGKFDLIRSANVGGKEASGLTMIVGGYLNAPGAIEPHLEFSHFYSYDKASDRIKLFRKNYERPKTLSQEYESAYLSYLENNRAEAVKKLERIVKAAKTAKSGDSADIAKACEELLSKIK